MRKTFPLFYLFLGFLLLSCGKDAVVHDFSGSAILKDKAVVTYELLLEFDSQKGLDEFMEKQEKINHAIRIILIQRYENQIDKQSRLISVISKIFKSQLNEPVKRITVKTFKIESAM